MKELNQVIVKHVEYFRDEVESAISLWQVKT